ncbi:hemin receptor [Sinimarinibacterium sp. CAU 1509]|uniref:globin family protein n=1 Tax=Sinimarinibacterium sp. CAU 1509 TaxID=2562283 RepID=UPI0010AC7406|nr:globin family protein [Sinimarinibacterium sp. CAU 1509]TJY58173.1 hemin receptor [Sinimarinibacterium sp. CAU 1509]
MTPTQVALVKSTWAQVLPIQDQAATLFYNKLFELDPRVQSMFRGDLPTQGKKLMRMLDIAVRGLDHFHALLPALKDLGRRHTQYGVRSDDYGTVALALLWTLEQGLGDAFTAEVRSAWTEVYTELATAMQTL